MPAAFLTGVVEGFYGREWDWPLRHAYADYLRRSGFNTYLYCPKSDAHLRKRWREPWPEETRARLQNLAAHYRGRDLFWGVGLSPFALYLDYSSVQRHLLKSRVGQIDDLGGAVLAVLFDDMPGDCPDLAARQAEIVSDIRAWSTVPRMLVCPTYYSFDPLLERHFGTMPPDYWASLGAALDTEIDIFWTGNQVCSSSITREDVRRIAAELGRRPVLWDNYPVNDGEQACRRLNLRPLHGRESGIDRDLRGHLCNPMNQGYLSRWPLTGLANLYRRDSPQRLEDIFPGSLADRLARDGAIFETAGLDGMGAAQRETLAVAYQTLYAESGEPAALEVAAWLRGEYAFDPACLTG